MDDAVAVLLWLFVAAYATFGGADFGGGVWDLFAGGAERGRRPRGLIDAAMTPVWEANNVWLIFALVLCWTGFPEAFAAIMSTMWIPLTVAVFCIVLRGSAFAFRHTMETVTSRRIFGVTFAVASVVSPFMFGCVLGGIAAGEVQIGELGGGDAFEAWTGPASMAVGFMAVVAGAFVAAAFLVYEARRRGDGEMEAYFRRRALVTALVAGVISFGTYFVLREEAPFVYKGLTHEGLPMVVLSILLGLSALVALWKGFPKLARFCAAGGVASVVWAWGLAQYPYILPTDLTIAEASADPQTQEWLLVIAVVAVLFVAPALWLLFRLDEGGELVAEDQLGAKN